MERIFIQRDFDRFAKLSGDFNPIHVDEKFASNSGFGKTVAHGILLFTSLSGALEKKIGQFEFINSSIIFPAPTYTNVAMTLNVEIIEEIGETKKVILTSQERISGTKTCIIEAQVRPVSEVEFILKASASKVIEPDKMTMPLYIGQKCLQKRKFLISDFNEFLALGGHKVGAGKISPILINAMFSKLLGIDLPGLGTNYLKQETQYLADAFIGDELSAIIEITRIREDKKIVDFSTTCINQNGKIITTGRALVSARDVVGAFKVNP